MGLLSFLTGNRTDSRSKSDETPAATTPAAEPVPAPPAAESPAANAVADAWDIDTGALTAPPPPKPADGPVIGPADPELTAQLQGPIIEVIKTVFDPEIPVDIYELGLIYDIAVDAQRQVLIKMTLKSPACPSAQQLPSEVRYKVKALPEVSEAIVDIVWEPAWDKERMSEVAKLQLGFL